MDVRLGEHSIYIFSFSFLFFLLLLSPNLFLFLDDTGIFQCFWSGERRRLGEGGKIQLWEPSPLGSFGGVVVSCEGHAPPHTSLTPSPHPPIPMRVLASQGVILCGHQRPRPSETATIPREDPTRRPQKREFWAATTQPTLGHGGALLLGEGRVSPKPLSARTASGPNCFGPLNLAQGGRDRFEPNGSGPN